MKPSDGKDIVILEWFIQSQYQRVTDRRTDGQTDGRAYYTEWAKKLHTVFIAITCLLSINFFIIFGTYTL